MLVYIYNDSFFHSSTKEEEEGYVLKDNETFLQPVNFIKPKFDNNEWIEGATEQDIENFLPNLQIRLDELIDILGNGAIRISSETQIDGYESKLKEQLYLFSKGEKQYLQPVYYQLYNIDILSIEESKRPDFKTWLLTIKLKGDVKIQDLEFFNAYIDTSLRKAQMLIDTKQPTKAKQVLDIMDSVTDTITRSEAQNLLNQIIAI